MLSPEGRCKTLDASADGYVRAEACGALMLRPFDAAPSSLLPTRGSSAAGAPQHHNAWTDGFLAVLAGSAVNQDGRSSSLTAPNGPAQQAVAKGALVASFGTGMLSHQVGNMDTVLN